MAAKDCISQIRDAMEGASDADVLKAAQEADRILDERRGQSTEEIMAALDEFILDEQMAARIEGRNKALNAMAVHGGKQFIASFGSDYKLGLEALLVGVNDVRMGARRSVAAIQTQLQDSYLAGITSDIEGLSDGHFDAFVNGAYDDDIARALWQIDNGDDFTGIVKEAVDIAKVIHKWQEVSRVDANKAGAFIKKMPGYITRQSHDMDKIRSVGKDEWINTIAPLLDERTFEGISDRQAYLESVYDALSSGVHLANGSLQTTSSQLKGFRNVGRAMSKERSLHFKDADSWIGYNKEFGRGELRESVYGGLMMSAQNTGLMKVLGPNAEMNYSAIVDSLEKAHRADPDFQRFRRATKHNGSLDNYLRAVTGEMNIPGGRHMLGLVASAFRSINSITMLGKAVISAIADIPISASEMRYQGVNFFEAYGSSLKTAGGALGDMGRSIANRKLTVKSKEHRRVLAELGIALDSTTGLFTNRFDPAGDVPRRGGGKLQDYPGRLSDGLNKFFRWNGLTIWTDSIRAGSMIGMANRMASYSGMQYGRIPKGVRDTMSLYGIGRGEWGLISKAGTKTIDGVEGAFIVPDMMRDIPDADIARHLEEIGVTPTDYQIKKTRDDLAESMRTYYVDRSQFAVIEPDTKTRAMMLQGTQPGTVSGELMRAIMQFKAFPVAIAQKVWGRELRGRSGRISSMRSMSEMMVMSMLFGYIAMSAKDMAKNRQPRTGDDPVSWGKIGMAAFLQGGGAGIYGDFLFGDIKNRFGGGAVSTLAGPTASQFDAIMNVWGEMREGDIDAGKSAFRLLYQNAPSLAAGVMPAAGVLNAGYTKAVLDNLIYYNVMEALSPGYKRRMERRMLKENNQEFLIK